MVWKVPTPFLIICLLTLDLFLVLDIKTKNKLPINSNILTDQKEVAGIRTVRQKGSAPTLSPSLSPSPTPSKVASGPGLNPSSNQSPALISTAKESSPAAGDLLQQINSFRSGKGLTPLSANSETCFFANIRVQEINSAFNHDGFTNRINSKTLPYPSYSSVAENIAMNSDSSEVIPGWINSSGHNENMSKEVPYGCVVGSGNYYVFEAWAP